MDSLEVLALSFCFKEQKDMILNSANTYLVGLKWRVMSGHNEVFLKFPSEVLKIRVKKVNEESWENLVNAFTTQRDGPKLDLVVIKGQSVVFQYNSASFLTIHSKTEGLPHLQLCHNISVHLLELFTIGEFKLLAAKSGDSFFPFDPRKAYNFDDVVLNWDHPFESNIKVEELDLILKNITANRFECNWMPSFLTTFIKTPIKFPHCVFPRGDWLTNEFLLAMDCITFSAADTRIQMNGLRGFIQQWLAGTNCRLETVSITYLTADFVPKKILYGLETVPWTQDNRPEYYGSIKCGEGLDVIRHDGKIATILFEKSGLFKTVFNFFVWSEHHLVNNPSFHVPELVVKEEPMGEGYGKPYNSKPLVLDTITLD